MSPFFPTAIDFVVSVLPFSSLARAKILAPGVNSERCPGSSRTTGTPGGTDTSDSFPLLYEIVSFWLPALLVSLATVPFVIVPFTGRDACDEPLSVTVPLVIEPLTGGAAFDVPLPDPITVPFVIVPLTGGASRVVFPACRSLSATAAERLQG